jgi:carbon-monoxide dehydrogenase medium subunit
MWTRYVTPATIEETLAALAQQPGRARLVAGATDLMLELERGQRPGVDVLIDISRLPSLDRIELGSDNRIHLGPLTTHNQVAGSSLIQERALALARACWEVGAPQIRNRATVAGNLITASPANDSIPPLMALGGSVTLRSLSRERHVPLASFYTGVRKTVMEPDEMLTDISFPAPPAGTRSTFVKFALRRVQAISVVNAAVVLQLDGDWIAGAAIALGSVAPTIIRAPQAEAFLKGKALSEGVAAGRADRFGRGARSTTCAGSARFPPGDGGVCIRRALRALATGTERDGFPSHPVMLWGSATRPAKGGFEHDASQPIETTINGRPYRLSSGQDLSLLRWLRDEAKLIGTKEGCAEGECGACTVFLDGAAVMACMVPAPRAHHADIVTIEGLARDGRLHPLQQAFLDEGAVQCGYCTPGFLMAGAKLLEETPHPDGWQLRQAITGNLCRCTGYYKILAAMERAGARPG